MSLTRRERVVVDRIDGVIRTVGTLEPPNPMDSSAKVRNLRVATAAARALERAITAWRTSDWDEVDNALTLAEGIVTPEQAYAGGAT